MRPSLLPKESVTRTPPTTTRQRINRLMIECGWLDSSASLRRKSILSFVRESCSGNLYYLNKRFFEAYFPGVWGTAGHTVSCTAGQPGCSKRQMCGQGFEP
jgi:hypothetical protein